MSISIYSDLPSMEHVFVIDVEGAQTKKRFTGQFKYRRPTISTKYKIAKTMASLVGEGSVDEVVKHFLQTSAFLEHCLVEYPTWWQESNYGRDLYDENIVDELVAKAMAFEDEWQKQLGMPSPAQ